MCDQRTDPKGGLEVAIITNKEDSGNIMAVWSQIGVCGLVLQDELHMIQYKSKYCSQSEVETHLQPVETNHVFEPPIDY